MFPLFESVCVLNGVIQHAALHQRRYEAACYALYQCAPAYPLFSGISVPEEYRHGKYKLKIQYDQRNRNWQFAAYFDKRIASLQIVEDDTIDYALKYTDRSRLNTLFQQRGLCDDVLIVKNGCVTDSTYCNIVLFDGVAWHAPEKPLLQGTARERLIEENRISPVDITLTDLPRYKAFKLINAMRDFDEVTMEPIENIHRAK